MLQHPGFFLTISSQMNIVISKVLKIWAIPCLYLLQFTLSAQSKDTTTSELNFSGSVDTYFRTNFYGDKFDSPATSFANLPGFALGMVNIVAEQHTTHGGMVADLVFGPRGTDAVFASPYYSATGNIINQLYAYWNASDELVITLGNFNTFIGYEVISPVDNFHYSTSYLFSYGPFSHTGLKADYAINENQSFMIAVMNPTDFTEMNNVNLYTYGIQYGIGGSYLSALYGKQAENLSETFQLDYTGSYDIKSSFSLGVNASYNNTPLSGGFCGVALYPSATLSKALALGLRGELFHELKRGGPVYGSGTTTLDFTITCAYTDDNLRLIAELRLDECSEPQFNTYANSNLSSLILAAVYSF
ncbi:MAG: hypothetical protein RL754_772 [Bacteroidota bacterium]